MLQKKCRELSKRRMTVLLLIVTLGVLAFGISGPVMAVEIPVLEGQAIESAKDVLPEAQLAGIWSLEHILQVALANGPSVKIADWELREALAGRQEVDAALKPQLSLAGQHKVENLVNNPAVLQGILGKSPGPLDPDERMSTTIGSLTYYQQLAPTAQLRGLTKQAEIGAEIAALRREQARKDLVVTVQSGYYDVLRAYNGLCWAREARQHAKLNLETAEDQLNLGTVTPLDVLRERNAYLEAEMHVQAATMGLELATLALLQNMGLGNAKLDTALAWAEQLAEKQDLVVNPWTIGLDAAYAYTLEHRPELAMVRKQREMAETAYTIVKEDRDWTIKLAGQYQPDDDTILQSSVDSKLALMGTVVRTKVDMPEILRQEPSQTQDLSFDTDPWQMELSASYRFGDGGARKAKLKAKEAAVEKAKLQEEMAKDGFYLDLNSRLQQLDQAWRAHELALEGEKAARETFEQLSLLYELGSVTGKEVREGRLMVLQAQNRVLDTGLAYEASKSKVAVAMGIDVETLIRVLVQNKWDGLLEN
ncbi:MAG: TolC family protein [Firmicutes bacterium]|nr:TolC family protein [Bacillota bacterium]